MIPVEDESSLGCRCTQKGAIGINTFEVMCNSDDLGKACAIIKNQSRQSGFGNNVGITGIQLSGLCHVHLLRIDGDALVVNKHF